MMQEWMRLMQPGEPHEKLKQHAGEWEATTRVWMGGPGTPAQEAKGTAVSRPILGGRFMQMDYSGSMMGMPMTGLGFMGYDNARNLYTSYWLDSMGTTVHSSKGQFDAEGKVLTLYLSLIHI